MIIRPIITDSARASAAEMPINPSMKTIEPSLTPQPAKEIGKDAPKITMGTMTKHSQKDKGISMPKASRKTIVIDRNKPASAQIIGCKIDLDENVLPNI